MIIQNGNRDQFKLPSDIKPGLYILRSELLSLHGNGHTTNPGLKGLPQFYTHCFNIEVRGSGNATPPGVRFPGGYQKGDPGVGFVLGNRARYASYVRNLTSNKGDSLKVDQPVPGPPVYEGRVSPPVGSKPIVTPQQLGAFPAAFDVKYKALIEKMNAWSDRAVDFFDSGKGGMSFIRSHQQEASGLTRERASLRQEAIKLGLADPNKRMQNSKIFKRSNDNGHLLFKA
jgi:Auxiliary Activity family 9 (formerly GH61)